MVAHLFKTITKLLLYLDMIFFNHCLKVSVCMRRLSAPGTVFYHRGLIGARLQ